MDGPMADLPQQVRAIVPTNPQAARQPGPSSHLSGQFMDALSNAEAGAAESASGMADLLPAAAAAL
jgi:hypothetical protein